MTSPGTLTDKLLRDPSHLNSSDNTMAISSSSSKVEKTSDSQISNQLVLQITCASFLIFVLAEVAGAIIGHSWSLLGDAAAMSVDVMTYFTNMLAERIKSREGGMVPLETKMILEVYVPLFSVCALLGVTAYVTVGSVHDILYKPEDDDVDIYIMYGFAIGNALVDVVSLYMFWAKGESVFQQDSRTLASQEILDDEIEVGGDQINQIVQAGTGKEKNLNMISAFTHVGGDTLRTFSIFFAALIANLGGGAPYLCDAWAAAVVTLTIVIMVIPLSREIWGAYWRITAEIEAAT
eukprot:GSChrysophyteH1.ASY1.ANO1.1774.1 assembled CDS